MHTPSSMIDTIKKRISVRTYDPKNIPDEIQTRLKDVVASAGTGPFKTKVELLFLENSEDLSDGKVRLGTYGVIKGAKNFIVAVISNGPQAIYDAGYILEKVILHCTELGLGTCWMGGTFDRGSFIRRLGLGAEQRIVAITPVGFPATSRHLIDKTIRMMAGSAKRKDAGELFFFDTYGTQLPKEMDPVRLECLETVRLAPSASNKQPWRVVVSRDFGSFHFYLEHDQVYARMLGFDIQKLDLGIAMSHFELAALEKGLAGEWQFDGPVVSEPKDLEYVASWVM